MAESSPSPLTSRLPGPPPFPAWCGLQSWFVTALPVLLVMWLSLSVVKAPSWDVAVLVPAPPPTGRVTVGLSFPLCKPESVGSRRTGVSVCS